MNNRALLTTLTSALLAAAPGCIASTEALPEDAEDVGVATEALSEAGRVVGVGGQCLDVQWGNPAAGTPVWMWPCNGGPAQRWRLTNAHEIRATDLGDKCLTAGFGTSSVYIGYCTGAPTQQWVLLQDGSIRSGADGSWCLDVAYAGTSPGTRVGITPCNPSLPSWPAQTWNFDSWASSLARGQSLAAHQQIRSRNGVYRLIMQGDCNLVLYQGTSAIWASDTDGEGSDCRAVMQTDGNFVVYNEWGHAVFATDTVGHGDVLELQDDNNLVVYQSTWWMSPSRWPTWSSRSGRLDDPPQPGGSGASVCGGAGWYDFAGPDCDCYGVYYHCTTTYFCNDGTQHEDTASGLCFGVDF